MRGPQLSDTIEARPLFFGLLKKALVFLPKPVPRRFPSFLYSLSNALRPLTGMICRLTPLRLKLLKLGQRPKSCITRTGMSGKRAAQ